MNWMLGLVFLVCSIPLWIVGYLFEGRYSEVSPAQPGPGGRPRHGGRGVGARHPRAQGVRSRQARAVDLPRAGRVAAQHRDREGAARSPASGSGSSWCRRRARRLPACSASGSPSQGAAHRRRARRVLRHGDGAARGRSSRSGSCSRCSVDARTATDRFFDILDSENAITDPERRVAIERPTRRARLQRRALPLPGLARPVRRPARRRRPRRSSRARPWRSSASPAAARPR